MVADEEFGNLMGLYFCEERAFDDFDGPLHHEVLVQSEHHFVHGTFDGHLAR
jgi:hypothetical protein